MLSRKINSGYKKIKENFIKKVTLKNINETDSSVLFELQIENFWFKDKSMKFILESKSQTKILSYTITNNKVSVELPIKLISELNEIGHLKFYFRNKKMLIKSNVEVNEDFIFNGAYFHIATNKHIILKRNFQEYTFHEEPLIVDDIQSDYETLTLKGINYNFELMHVKEPHVIAINKNKMRQIDTVIDLSTNNITVKNLSLFSQGDWLFYLRIKKEIHPIRLNYSKTVKLKTYHHSASIMKTNKSYMKAVFSPHVITLDSATFENLDQDHITLSFSQQELELKGNAKLIVEEPDGKLDISKQLTKIDDYSFETIIDMRELFGNFKVVRFFVETGGIQPLKYQFYIKQKQMLNGNAKSFHSTVNSQITGFKFYRRKDKSLGLMIRKPRLRKLVTDVEGFSVSGFLGSMERFKECKPYLLLEDRLEQKSVKYPLAHEFTINFNPIDLLGIKSRGKTVIDLFVIVEDSSGYVIRKEKIKYEKANYKKDNYYAYITHDDEERNQHHFLITTTPFNNLKIETFMIPNFVEIPSDTSRKDNKTWLIGERTNTAQDNGYILFKYLQRETDLDVYYVIDSESEDYEKIKDNEHVLSFGSKEHFEIAFKAKVLLGTHDLENLLPYKPAKGFFNYENTFKVFLQHGVLGRKNVEYHKKFYEDPFDLFIVSSDPEKYDVVMDQLGYEEEEVKVTGLARFDRLYNVEKPRDILLMPTWRDWINTDEKFLESEYYNRYISLINNQELLELLNKYDVNLNFYPHYRSQDYFSIGLSENNERVKFIQLGKKKVQDLLREHALLITDFSSVSFDFTLLGKPVIYYHFDVRQFFRRGILRPVDETFLGRIAHTEEDLVELIKERLELNFANYENDLTQIVKYQDKNNCKRIYDEVIKGLDND
ncbi:MULTISPECIES: CDP-glycerol glycerophosphotransferase family protein [Allobacillus]|uniref:Teichoic acid biosynthesis protein n=1 Tax=Allobacillus salarius TaxID=1955272 RepID=A0A556PMN3_9BACI|nr:CDP-glycerol glycerophosphotransferase family protein [Allobacillus salarius]TSJ65660.1 teichoic acid biosynthesis protein [Allobacillus salarius]